MIAVVENGSFVASAGAYTFDLTIPGAATVPVAGVTWVGVLPTHRRRGILSQMMKFQLDDVVARGEPLAVLTASEAVIYGRYGYGVGSRFAEVEIKTRRSEFPAVPEPGGSMRLVWGDEAAKLVPPLYDAWRRARNGAVSRNDGVWTYNFQDKEWNRHGWGPQFVVVHQTDAGEADGFARYRVKQGEETNQAKVIEVIALDTEVEAALWRFVLDLDLTTVVEGSRQPVDDALRWRLADSRLRRQGPVGLALGPPARRTGIARGSALRHRRLAGVRGRRPVPSGRRRGRPLPPRRRTGRRHVRAHDRRARHHAPGRDARRRLPRRRPVHHPGRSQAPVGTPARCPADAMFFATPQPFCNTPFLTSPPLLRR